MYRELMIKDIVRMIDGETIIEDSELVRGISIHSKTTKPGDLFFALKGERTDGHLYAQEAIDNGAIGVVVQHRVGLESEILVLDTLFALGKLAQEYRKLFHPKTIGITGTNGKTTVKKLISAILRKKYRVLCTKKNFNSLIGLPLTVLELTGNEDFLVLEMGTSSRGEIKRLCEIAQPSIGVITNIGPGHLKGLMTIEGVRQEKLVLVHSLSDDGFALVGDGVGEIDQKDVTKFSLDMATDIELSEKGSWFVYKDTEFFTPLLGYGNVYNCLAALCLTSKLGIEPDEQSRALAEIKAEPGRLEPLPHNGVFIINDTYNANPVSMRASIDFVATLKRRKVFIFGDMKELGKQSKTLHKQVGGYARKYCEILLTLGNEARFYGGKHFKERGALIRYLLEQLHGDEAILVKASRLLHFEDIVADLLKLL